MHDWFIISTGLATRSLFVRSSFVPFRSYCPPQLFSSVEEHPQPVEGKICGKFNNRYLFGHIDSNSLPQLGTIPPWLSGRLIRNGPGLFEVGDTKYSHLFDGLSLLHSFTIDQGKLWLGTLPCNSLSYSEYHDRLQERSGIKVVS